MQYFAKELYVASGVDHENVIKLSGYIMEEGHPSLVLPWAGGGTLPDYIKKHPDYPLLPIVCNIFFTPSSAHNVSS